MWCPSTMKEWEDSSLSTVRPGHGYWRCTMKELRCEGAVELRRGLNIFGPESTKSNDDSSEIGSEPEADMEGRTPKRLH